MDSKQPTAETIKTAIDLAIDKCVEAIIEAKKPYQEPTVRLLIQHRIVNSLWFTINQAVLSAVNHQGLELQEMEKQIENTTQP